MIIDLKKFITERRSQWTRLEQLLDARENDPLTRMSLEELLEFHNLYQRVSADLAQITTFAAEAQTRAYLESLVARAYGDVFETRTKHAPLAPLRWFLQTFPQTFRRHINAFWLALFITMLGFVFGAGAILLDPDSKNIIFPEQFGHLQQSPSERVRQEEFQIEDRLDGQRSIFSTTLMTHNTRVTVFAMAMGMSWGIGTIILLFYNGLILGGVIVDYILAGETTFLIGWLLPHGSIEIPAILLGGQAGFVLGNALIGWGKRIAIRDRLRQIAPDLVTIISAAAILLIWAGIIEAFLSQYHEPIIPYSAKIAFGTIELIVLILFLSFSGRKKSMPEKTDTPQGPEQSKVEETL